ncbi:MAG: xanthine dehydrogenase family protein subunit M [Kouleothrix sp.]|jgi:carbon-monoxide dehydrogenase medium subunit|nr:xanthine dehydrogenase family protein subunit M [Kouleothrix sp.]
MIPSEFQYFAPTTIDEAVGLLAQHGDAAKLIAGGHSLLPAMKLRLTAPGVLIDVSRIDGLQGITVNGALTIGAGTTYHAIASSEAVRTACGVLAECVEQIGDPQVRNRGTIGGSLAHADPAADLPAVVLALDARVTARGPGGERAISADDMFVEMLTTALGAGEIITAVQFPKLGAGEGAAYAKLRQPASRYAIVGVAAYVKLGAGGSVAAARIAVTGAGAKATRQPAAEAALVGSSGDAAAVAAAADQAGDSVDYLGDIHASEEYRRAMVKVYTRRALGAALARARG